MDHQLLIPRNPNAYDRGVLATNTDLVRRAAAIVENMGVRLLGPEAVRDKLGLRKL